MPGLEPGTLDLPQKASSTKQFWLQNFANNYYIYQNFCLIYENQALSSTLKGEHSRAIGMCCTS